jgi:glycosyltransferase involved in cell wall biosynthesis
MPSVSVVIPAFNAESTIIETVESVLSQSFTDFELLLINDGSTDGTLSQLAEIKDSRLRILSFPNGGVAASRNRGIEHSTGAYIAFLDADDVWSRDKLKEQLAALATTPRAAVAYSWNDYIDKNGAFVHHGWHPKHQGDVYEALFCCCFIENGSNILVKREAIAAVGLFDATATPAEDWDFYLRLAEKYDFVCIPKVHVFYRIIPTSLSTQVERMERGGLIALGKALQRSPQRLTPLKSSAFVDFYSYLFYKAYNQSSSRQQWWTTLKIFGRGVYQSPTIWNRVAKRRLWRVATNILLAP